MICDPIGEPYILTDCYRDKSGQPVLRFDPAAQQENNATKSLTDTELGALMAVSIFIALHDQPGMAADVLNELGLAAADCSHLDDYDKQNLKKIQGERGVSLRGL